MKRLTASFAIFAFSVTSLSAFTPENTRREFSRTTEKELSIIIDVAFGTLYVERGPKDRVAVVDYDQDTDDKLRIAVSYEVSGSKGTLRIKTKKDSKIWKDENSNDHGDDRRITVMLSEDLPIDFDLELGAGRGELDVTGLRIRQLRIETGASSVELMCEKPNPIVAEKIEIESGVSKFTGTNLSNLNFRVLNFSGGIGSYKLDFGGALRQSAKASIEVGLGSIVVNIPSNIAARVVHDESWLSSSNLDDEFIRKRGDVYETREYQDADHRLDLSIESGLGSVKVRRY